MNIYFKEYSLDEGFKILSGNAQYRRFFNAEGFNIKGKIKPHKLNRPNAWPLFSSMRNKDICCFACSIKADRWVNSKYNNNKIKSTVINLYAGSNLITQDHIIPKSLGGVDSIQNLRPACEECNRKRRNLITDVDIKFAQENPKLICKIRIEKGIKKLKQAIFCCKTAQQIKELYAPFEAMGLLESNYQV